MIVTGRREPDPWERAVCAWDSREEGPNPQDSTAGHQPRGEAQAHAQLQVYNPQASTAGHQPREEAQAHAQAQLQVHNPQDSSAGRQPRGEAHAHAQLQVYNPQDSIEGHQPRREAQTHVHCSAAGIQSTGLYPWGNNPGEKLWRDYPTFNVCL